MYDQMGMPIIVDSALTNALVMLGVAAVFTLLGFALGRAWSNS